jgi:hypothetical protein
MNSRLILLPLLALAAHSQRHWTGQQVRSPQMAVYARMSLTKQTNGIDGELRVSKEALKTICPKTPVA